jgi:hypothetical protein
MPDTDHQTPEDPRELNRLAYRISEWSALTGTSRQHTWRAIRNGALKVVDYNGIQLIPSSEAVRLKLLDANR